jgi:hypothetical protein
MQERPGASVSNKKRDFPQIRKQVDWICPSRDNLPARNVRINEERFVKEIGSRLYSAAFKKGVNLGQYSIRTCR